MLKFQGFFSVISVLSSSVRSERVVKKKCITKFDYIRNDPTN